MELVDGLPLTDYCDQHGLDIPARLKLFAHLCSAVQHAHEKGIVHRDLKPTNVLVQRDDRNPVPKVIDFGLAKYVHPATYQTETGVILGTPSYMAPEQADAGTEQVGPSCDLYALGAILYELLTGRTPFRGISSWDTIQQLLRDDPIPPRSLNPRVSKALETLCLKCLEKDPRRRIQSAKEIEDNLARIETGRPLTVRPVSRVERVARWGRRKPWQALLVTSTSIFVTVLCVLLLYLARARSEAGRHLVEAQQATREADRMARIAEGERDSATAALALSERREAEARATGDFLADLFRSSDPLGFSGTGLRQGPRSPRDILAIDLLDVAKQRLVSLDAQPLVQATVMDTLGAVYHSIGSLEVAEQLLRGALELRRERLPEDHPDVATSLQNIGHLLHSEGKFAESEQLLRQSLAIRRACFGDNHLLTSETMFRLASCLGYRQFDQTHELNLESLRLLEEVVRIRRRHFPEENDRLLGLSLIGIVSFRLGGTSVDDVLPDLAKAVQVLVASGAGEEFGQCLAKYAIAAGLRRARQYEACRRVHAEMLESLTHVLGERHPLRIMALADYAGILKQAGDIEASLSAIREALELGRQSPLYFHPGTIDSLRELADFLHGQGEHDEAERLYREAIQIARKTGQQARLERLTTTLTARLRESGRAERSD
jgi:tetratricopeptide (TPR) repeat protein